MIVNVGLGRCACVRMCAYVCAYDIQSGQHRGRQIFQGITMLPWAMKPIVGLSQASIQPLTCRAASLGLGSWGLSPCP